MLQLLKLLQILLRNTPTIFANNRAVVAFNSTVPKTIINTKGVIYSAPGTPSLANFKPNKEAIPAATIPRGPTQLIKSFSFNFNVDPCVLKNTPIGRIIKTTDSKKYAVFQCKLTLNRSHLYWQPAG